jgi:4-hydroxy-tetrahydrodipicolinate synthase
MLNDPMPGIIPPLVTPLLGRDELDVAGLERLLRHVLAGSVHGLFILGTTGEAPDLSYRLRREVISRVCSFVGGRLPIFVGITDTAFVESLNLAAHAGECGATALVSAAPYYFPAGQPELRDFVERLVSELPLPLFLYNMPQMTKVRFEIDTVRCVSHLKGIAGVKDSSGDLEYFRQLTDLARAERPDWEVFMGPEHLLVDAIRRGAHGGVNGGGQIDPQMLVGLYEAARDNDTARVEILQARLIALGEIYKIGHHASAVIKGIKCALSLMGICDDAMAEPMTRFLPPERARVKAILDKLQIRTVEQ